MIFKERLTRKKTIGLFIGFLGFIPTLIAHAPQELIYGEAFFISLPELCIIISVFSAAYSWISIQQSNVPLILLNGVSMLCGGILSLTTSLFFESWNPLPVYDFKNFLFLILLITIIGNFVCYNLYGYLLKKYTATFLSFAGFTIPLFTALMQFIFFNAVIGIDFIITIIMVSTGLYIFYQEELEHGITKA
jgi:drug/metabolite transporter (DMT)-like permease